MLKRIWLWIVYSSANADKISLTVKGFAATGVTVVTMIVGLAHLHIGNADITQVFDGIVALIQAGLIFISSIVTLVGIIRKIVRTADGTNAVINTNTAFAGHR